ncbi:MAG: hypothetical protein ACKVWR_14375 [Acidimicrobiales bacterium]
MSAAGYVAAGYVLVLGPLALYVARVLGRSRRLARQVPEARRRWM